METQQTVKKTGILDLLAYRNFSILLVASFISRFGDSVDGIAYGWMVYKLTGSKLLLGTLFAVNAIPNIILGPFAGVMADRMDNKKLMALSYAGRGIIVSLAAALFMLGFLRPWHLFAFTVITSTLETLMTPATISVLPLLINKDLYLSANSFSSSVSTFAQLIGTGAAGVIIALWGIGGAILVDGATFFAAAFLTLLMSIPKTEFKSEKLNLKTYIKDIKEGIDCVRKSHLIRLTIILFAIVNFCITPINVLMPAFIKDVLNSGPEISSLLGIAFSVGIIAGGIVIGQIGSRFKITNLITVGFCLFGISYGMMVLPGYIIKNTLLSVIITTISFLAIGFLIPVVSSPIKAHMMKNTEQRILGRVASFMSMISLSAIPLGSAVTGAISEYISISVIFLCMGTIVALVAASLLFNKSFRNAEN